MIFRKPAPVLLFALFAISTGCRPLTPAERDAFNAQHGAQQPQQGATRPGMTSTGPGAPSGPTTGAAPTSGGGSGASCCVNHAFYDCPSAVAAGQCLGQPQQLVDCLMACHDSSCQRDCNDKHGPRPKDAGCRRATDRDGECR